jgi:DNA-binding YbaB/EbfC family protein
MMGKGMRAGKKPKNRQGGGGGDMQKQLRQLQAMQAEMEKTQAELEEKEVTTTAGGGAIEVTVNGKREIVKLNIDKDVVDPDDVEMLQDLVIAAVNEALRQIAELEETEMGRVTGGMGGLGIPGF